MRIVLMQRKVGNLEKLGRTTGWIHMATLVKSGRVHNMGAITKLHIAYFPLDPVADYIHTLKLNTRLRVG